MAKDIKLKITIDGKEAEVSVRRLDKAVKDLGDNEFSNLRREFSSTFSSFVGNIAAEATSFLTSKLIEGGKAILDYSAKLEQTKIGFQTLMGSSQAAQKHLKDLEQFAKDTPFEFAGLADASRRFQNVGLDASRVIPIMRSVGDAVAAAGGSSESLDRVTLAISQIIAKGKVSAEEINQLAENGIGGWRILSEQLGKSKAEVIKLAEQGKISSEVFLDAFDKFSQANFGGAMEKQSKTFSGAMSTIKDTLLIAANTYFEPLYAKISEIAVRTTKELEGADFDNAVKIVAKNIATGLGEALTDELKNEWKNINWSEIFTPNDIGAALQEGLTGGFSLEKFILGGASKSQTDFIKYGGLIGSLFYNESNFNAGDVIKQSINALNQTYTGLGRVKDLAEDVPSLADKLKADLAAHDLEGAEKQAKALSNILDNVNDKVAFFGQETEVAATKQALLNAGIYDFSAGQAKTALEMAGVLDNLKKAQKEQQQYNDKIKNSSEYMRNLRENAELEITFPNASELDKFDFWVKRQKLNFSELHDEIKATRESLQSAAIIAGVQKSLEANARAFAELDERIGRLRETAKNPLQDAAADLAKSLSLKGIIDNTRVDVSPEAFGRQIEGYVNAYNTLLSLSGKSEELGKIRQSFKDFLSTFKFNAGGKDLQVFGDRSELDDAVSKFLALGDAIETANKNAAEKSYSTLLSELTEKTNQAGQSSEYNRVKKQLETEAYKNLNDEQRKNLLLKANEVDASGINRGLQEQLELAQRGGRELSVYEKTLRDLETTYKNLSQAEKDNLLAKAAQVDAVNEAQKAYEDLRDIIGESLDAFAEDGWQGLFDSIKNRFKRFLLDLATEFLTSQFFKLFSKGGSSSGGSGGGFFGSLLNGIRNIFNPGGGGGLFRTPNFNPNSSNPFSMFNTGGGTTWQGLGAYAPSGSSGGSSNSSSGFSSIFGSQGFGNNVGTYNALGALTTLAGGFLPGRLGSTVSGAGMGLSLGASIGTFLFPGIGTGLGAVLGAGIGGLLGLFGFSDKKRKADKAQLPTLNQGFADALAQIRAIGADKRAFYSNPEGSIAKALELRQQIASGFGLQWQSKKYRGEAQKQIAAKLAEADQIIAELNRLKDRAVRARDIDTQLQTSFAGGVYMNEAFLNQYGAFKRRNGMLGGSFTGRDTLPSMLAQGEMVLNPLQIARVIRNAGFDAFKGAGIPGYADGAFIQPSAPTPTFAPASPQILFQPNITLVLEGEGVSNVRIKEVLFNGLKSSEGQAVVVEAYEKGKSRKIGN